MTTLFLLQTAAERLDAARQGLDTPFAERLIGLLGMAVMIGLAVLLSYDRKKINWRLAAAGLGVQAVFGVILDALMGAHPHVLDLLEGLVHLRVVLLPARSRRRQ